MLHGLGAMGLVIPLITYHHAVWFGCYRIGHYSLHLSQCCMAWVLLDLSLPSSLITMLYGLGAMGLVTTIFSITMLYGLGAMGLVTTIFSITMLYGLGAMGLVIPLITYQHAVWFGCYRIGHYSLHLSQCCMAWVLLDLSLPSSLITMLYRLGAMGLVTTIFTYHHAVWLGCYGIGHYHLHLSPCCMAWVLWDWSLPSSLITMLYGLGAIGLVTTIFTYHHAVWFGCYGIGHYHLHLSPCCMVWVLWDWSLPSSV